MLAWNPLTYIASPRVKSPHLCMDWMDGKQCSHCKGLSYEENQGRVGRVEGQVEDVEGEWGARGGLVEEPVRCHMMNTLGTT